MHNSRVGLLYTMPAIHARGNLLSVRLWLPEEAWAEIAPILTARKSPAGSPPVLSARMCIGIREQLVAHAIVPVIPPKSNRRAPFDYEKALYKLREQVERCFNNLKQLRRIATRYEHLSQTFLAFMHLVAAWIIIKSFVNTP